MCYDYYVGDFMKNKILLLVLILFGFSIKVNAQENFHIVNVLDKISCNSVFGNENDPNSLMHVIKYDLYDTIKIAAPILFLLLESFDFAKAVFSNNQDIMKKAKNNLLKRGLALLIIFFAPDIINILLDFINSKSCV